MEKFNIDNYVKPIRTFWNESGHIKLQKAIQTVSKMREELEFDQVASASLSERSLKDLTDKNSSDSLIDQVLENI